MMRRRRRRSGPQSEPGGGLHRILQSEQYYCSEVTHSLTIRYSYYGSTSK